MESGMERGNNGKKNENIFPRDKHYEIKAFI